MTDKFKIKNLISYLAVAAVILSLSVSLFSCGSPGDGSDSGTSLSSDENLTIHFLDVGQADSTLLISKGEAMLVDAGNRDDDDLIVSYLNELGIEELKYIVFTHPHEDHIGAGEAVLNNFSVDKVFMLDEYDEGIEGSLKACIERKNITAQAPSPGEKADFGECEIEFLGPFEDHKSPNDDSICLMVRHGDNSIMFTGDAGSGAERDVIENNGNIEADILQAGHHGSSTSNSYYFLRQVNPRYVVISCGEGNMYGHPHEEALSRFSDLGAEVFRTDEQGTIIAEDNGENITFNCKGKQAEMPYRDEAEEADYIGNVNSKKYHRPDCAGLPKEENRVYFMSREKAESAGYEPCGNCHPDE